jgi:hypothetical protein
VGRLGKDPGMNDRIADLEQEEHSETISFEEAGRPLQLHIQSPGTLDSLCFRTDDSAAEDLQDDEIEIQVKSCGLKYLHL